MICPYFIGLLVCQIASWYFHNAKEHIKKITDTIGFLSALSLSRFEVLQDCMQKMSTKTRRFVADHQYNFNPCYFVTLGQEIPRIIEIPKGNQAILFSYRWFGCGCDMLELYKF